MMRSRLSSSDDDESSPMRAAATILASAAANSSNLEEGVSSFSSTTIEDTSQPEASEPDGPLSSTVTHEQRWETMFERLKAYKETHGNCLVPNRYSLDSQLGSWVSAQRRQYKIVTCGGNESAAMTAERAKKLREIGFEWSTSNPRNVPWDTRFLELKRFVANYGHAEVPMRWEENPQLSNWVSKQRHQYKLMLNNRPSRLNNERVQMLNKLGFVWEASRRRLGDSDVEGSSDDKSDTGSSIAVSSKETQRKRSRKTDPTGQPAVRRQKTYPLPTFAEGKPGRFGLDPPAPMGTSLPTPGGLLLPGTIEFVQAQAQALAAAAVAGQVGAPLANFGLWAAMASGQAGYFLPPPAIAAAAAAAAPGMTPQLFLQMSSMIPFGAAVPGMTVACPELSGPLPQPELAVTGDAQQENPEKATLPPDPECSPTNEEQQQQQQQQCTTFGKPSEGGENRIQDGGEGADLGNPEGVSAQA